MQITISELNQYLQCPRSYKIREIDGIEPEYKRLSSCKTATVRKVIAEFYASEKKPSDYSKREVETICERVWQEETADHRIDQAELENIVVQAKSQTKTRPAVPAVTKGQKTLANIKTWVFEFTREEMDAEVLYSNVYFLTTIGDCEFVGRLDQIRKINDEIQILIFNTGSQAPNKVFLQRDFVASIHAHALWHGLIFPEYPNLEKTIELKTIPSVAVYYFPHLERYQRKTGIHKKGDRKGNPLIEISVTQDILINAEYETMYTVSGIQNEFFPKMPRLIGGCAICPYANQCNGSIFREVDTSFDFIEYEKQSQEQEVIA